MRRVMGVRISLAALRDRVNGRYAVGAFVGPSDLLALVEAVEAARAVAASPETDGDSLLLSDLDIALARFDFEDASRD